MACSLARVGIMSWITLYHYFLVASNTGLLLSFFYTLPQLLSGQVFRCASLQHSSRLVGNWPEWYICVSGMIAQIPSYKESVYTMIYLQELPLCDVVECTDLLGGGELFWYTVRPLFSNHQAVIEHAFFPLSLIKDSSNIRYLASILISPHPPRSLVL
jgi:hypothetical protein